VRKWRRVRCRRAGVRPGARGRVDVLDALQRPLTSPWALLLLVGARSLLGALHPGHGNPARGVPRRQPRGPSGLGLLLVAAAPLLSRCTGPRFRWGNARLPLLLPVVVAILGVVMTVSGLSGLAT
jgi:nickel/cobalt exporter